MARTRRTRKDKGQKRGMTLRTAKKILAGINTHVAQPNTLATVQRLAYNLNTRVKVYARDHKSYAFACRHRKQGLTFRVPCNGLKAQLCRVCHAKVEAGAMLVPPAPKKGKAKAAGAGR